MLTAIEHGSVGPKRMAKAISESKAVYANVKMKLKFQINELESYFVNVRRFCMLCVYDKANVL
jgi:hypothetical protein